MNRLVKAKPDEFTAHRVSCTTWSASYNPKYNICSNILPTQFPGT
jgi:hypothetical protein